jgi:hypothetical protein
MDQLQFTPELKNERLQLKCSENARTKNRMDRIGNNKGRVQSISSQMSDRNAISAKRDGISRKTGRERIGARFENCLGIGEDPIDDVLNGELVHSDLDWI